jgi:hypothetical protein
MSNEQNHEENQEQIPEHERVYRPSFSKKELETVLKAIYFRKKALEKAPSRTFETEDEMTILANLFSHFSELIHGKVQGRRKTSRGFEAWSDDSMIYFKLVNEKWISQVKLELGEQT